MKRSFTSGLIFKLAFNFIIIVCIVFFIGNSIQLRLNQNELEKQGLELIHRQEVGYAEEIDKIEKYLINQFSPLIDMIAEFSKAPLLAKISETDHSNIDVVGSLQNCFNYYENKDDIKQCTDLLVFRFIANNVIAEINQTFISTAINFLIKNDDLVGVFVEDWDEETYIGFYRSPNGALREWRQLESLSQFPYIEKDILDEENEYLGKIVFAYDLSRIDLLKQQAKTRLLQSTEQIKKNIQKNHRVTIRDNLIGGILFSVVLVVSLFLMSIRLIIRPIHSLEDSANQIARGDLNTRSGIYSKDEIGSLAKSFNKMAKNLQDTMTSKDELIHEVEQRQKVEEKLLVLSITDELTGAYNRRAFNDSLHMNFGRAKRYDEPLSMLMIDIDHFKKINDSHGHDVGDLVLKDLVRVISENIRQEDSMARWGGEEFAVLLPQTVTDAALQQAERLREKISAHAFPKIDHLTVSIGHTEIQADDTCDSFSKRADDALYQAKESGRDIVVSC